MVLDGINKAWVRVLYVDGLGKLFGKFVEW